MKIKIFVLPNNLNCTTDPLFEFEVLCSSVPRVGESIYIAEADLKVTDVGYYFDDGEEDIFIDTETSVADLANMFKFGGIEPSWAEKEWDDILKAIKDLRPYSLK